MKVDVPLNKELKPFIIADNNNSDLLDLGIMVRVFANGLDDQGLILGRVIPQTQKMVLDASLLNTQHYKISIKGKVKQSKERAIPQCSSY